ncbi:MAG: hypothetical protein N2Z63_03555, partial [Thiobacillaceae bacterium]|nr:hypothetical protein [Thiobacillaceae bacterium]
MQRRYDQFNPKRRLRQATPQALAQLQPLVERACYGGNPEHKRDPGDFGLTPPAAPRPAKSLCDVAQVFTRREAQRLLKEG